MIKDWQPTIGDYVIREDRSVDGAVTVRREGDAPEWIEVSLELIQAGDPKLFGVRYDQLQLLTDTYRIVGWNADHGALVCRRVDD